MRRLAKASFSSAALQHNFQIVQQKAPISSVIPVIKADAYGHGAEWVVKSLSIFSIALFAVATCDEAKALIQKISDVRLLILDGCFSQEEFEWASTHNAQVVIHTQKQLDWLSEATPAAPLNIWLKINTGMNRLGIDPNDFNEVLSCLANSKHVNKIVLMTHLACADQISDFTSQQLQLFSRLTQDLPYPKSIANSAAIFRFQEAHQDWVRPGIMLYGSSPFPDVTAAALYLKPVMNLVCYIICVRAVEAGAFVGYGLMWQAPKASYVAIISIGYGDGFPRHLDQGEVWIKNQKALVLGRISMDMVAIDVTHISGVALGDEVELWGEHIPIDDVAKKAGTLSYELFCQLTSRVEREYV